MVTLGVSGCWRGKGDVCFRSIVGVGSLLMRSSSLLQSEIRLCGVARPTNPSELATSWRVGLPPTLGGVIRASGAVSDLVGVISVRVGIDGDVVSDLLVAVSNLVSTASGFL